MVDSVMSFSFLFLVQFSSFDNIPMVHNPHRLVQNLLLNHSATESGMLRMSFIVDFEFV